MSVSVLTVGTWKFIWRFSKHGCWRVFRKTFYL